MKTFNEYMEGAISGGYRGEEDNLPEILMNFKEREEVIKFMEYCLEDIEKYFRERDIRYNSPAYDYIDHNGFNISQANSSSDIGYTASYVDNIVYNNVHAKAWNEEPTNKAARNRLINQYYFEYEEIARRWLIRLENPHNDLVGLSRSEDFDHLTYDMLQDDDDLRDTLIPWNGVRYYLNVYGYTDRFVGTSQDSVIEQIKRSPERDKISEIIRRMVR